MLESALRFQVFLLYTIQHLNSNLEPLTSNNVIQIRIARAMTIKMIIWEDNSDNTNRNWQWSIIIYISTESCHCAFHSPLIFSSPCRHKIRTYFFSISVSSATFSIKYQFSDNHSGKDNLPQMFEMIATGLTTQHMP